MKINVLFVIKGSALNRRMNTGIENLAWGLAELGMNIHILSGGSSPESTIYNIPNNVHYHFTGKQTSSPESYFEKYLNIVEDQEISAVVGWVSLIAPLSNLILNRPSSPAYIVNQGHLTSKKITSRIRHSIGLRIFNLQIILKNKAEIADPARPLLSIRNYYTKINKVISISKAVQKNIIKIYGFNPKICSVVYRGVDTETYYAKKRNRMALGNHINILFAGNILKSKGVEDLIDSTALIDNRCNLVFCGNGDKEYIAKLKERFSDITINDSIVFTGPLSQKELIDHYHNCDVFVFPSFREGLGKALLEAMACGCPVIASDIAAVREIIVDRQNGLIVPTNSPHAIAEAIEEFIQNPQLATFCSKNARQTIQNHFSKESEVSEWFKILTS